MVLLNAAQTVVLQHACVNRERFDVLDDEISDELALGIARRKATGRGVSASCDG